MARLAEDGKTVTRFSITGYSLGGLVARYLVGVLHQRKFFETVTPVNFMTVATPHIGLVRYPTFRSSLFAYLGPRLLSRTGEQFYAMDKWSANGRPLLEVMADPGMALVSQVNSPHSHTPVERIFYQALVLFPHIRIYANAVNDVTVPYLTAAIETEDCFADHAWNGLEMYVASDSCDISPPIERAADMWHFQRIRRDILSDNQVLHSAILATTPAAPTVNFFQGMVGQHATAVAAGFPDELPL